MGILRRATAVRQRKWVFSSMHKNHKPYLIKNRITFYFPHIFESKDPQSIWGKYKHTHDRLLKRQPAPTADCSHLLKHGSCELHSGFMKNGSRQCEVVGPRGWWELQPKGSGQQLWSFSSEKLSTAKCSSVAQDKEPSPDWSTERTHIGRNGQTPSWCLLLEVHSTCLWCPHVLWAFAELSEMTYLRVRFLMCFFVVLEDHLE